VSSAPASASASTPTLASGPCPCPVPYCVLRVNLMDALPPPSAWIAAGHFVGIKMHS